MIQLRELRLSGPRKKSATVKFVAGANVIAGASDTGKSYLFRCMDYVLGAEKMSKKVDEDDGYDTVQLELLNSEGKTLTLTRHLSGSDIRLHRSPIDQISGDGETVAWKRKGKSPGPDLTSALFAFAGIKEASLRKNAKGKTVRLTVRTLLPVFLVNETAIIAEASPIYGGEGFDKTSRQRMLSYVMTGLDDAGIISAEQDEIVQAAARAKLMLVSELLAPVEERLNREQPFTAGEPELTIDRADEAIERLSSSLAENSQERQKLQADRSEAVIQLQTASSQIVALDQLLQRYALLKNRYESDLRRLDFIAEGSHFLGQLQEVRCPLCDQMMDAEHKLHLEGHSDAKSVYQSSKAEAGKIIGLKNDLTAAVESLQRRRAARETERDKATTTLNAINGRIDRELAPALQATKARLDSLFARRVQLEAVKTDTEQAEGLRELRASLEKMLEKPSSAKKTWTAIDPVVMQKLSKEIEVILKEWAWPGGGRVEFDSKEFDIKVDGKPRQSHSKGVRAILHAAFIFGLLNYCSKQSLPHPGFVVLDSPLTTYKQGQVVSKDDAVDPTIESHFWASLVTVPKTLQIVVIDNKEPPEAVATSVAYTFFAGPNGTTVQRKGFIPT